MPTLAGAGRAGTPRGRVSAGTRRLRNETHSLMRERSRETAAVWCRTKLACFFKPGMPSEGREYVVGPGTLLVELALFADQVDPPMSRRRAGDGGRHPRSRRRFREMLEGCPGSARRYRDVMASPIDELDPRTVDGEDDDRYRRRAASRPGGSRLRPGGGDRELERQYPPPYNHVKSDSPAACIGGRS